MKRSPFSQLDSNAPLNKYHKMNITRVTILTTRVGQVGNRLFSICFFCIFRPEGDKFFCGPESMFVGGAAAGQENEGRHIPVEVLGQKNFLKYVKFPFIKSHIFSLNSATYP